MLPRWCVVEHSDGGVEHLIVSDHEETWVEDGLFSVEHGLRCRSGQAREVLLYQVNELVMADGACAYDDHILSEVVASMEVHYHIACDLANVVDVAEDGLAHHVLTKDIEVDILHQSLLRVLVHSFKFLPDSVLLKLNMVAIVCAIAEHIAHDFNGTRHAIWELSV